jgi:hypothetical protein
MTLDMDWVQAYGRAMCIKCKYLLVALKQGVFGVIVTMLILHMLRLVDIKNPVLGEKLIK